MDISRLIFEPKSGCHKDEQLLPLCNLANQVKESINLSWTKYPS